MVINFKQIDVEDTKEPIQNVNSAKFTYMNGKEDKLVRSSLRVSQFIDQDNGIGVFLSEPDPDQLLQVENLVEFTQSIYVREDHDD